MEPSTTVAIYQYFTEESAVFRFPTKKLGCRYNGFQPSAEGAKDFHMIFKFFFFALIF